MSGEAASAKTRKKSEQKTIRGKTWRPESESSVDGTTSSGHPAGGTQV